MSHSSVKQHLCPVCGMNAEGSGIEVEHMGMSYYFCMEQCKQNFLVRPMLYRGEKSPRQSGRDIIKRRVFALEQPLSGLQREGLKAALSQLMSVRNLHIDADRVSIDYNLLEISASQIEAALEQAGARMGSGWAARLKRNWIHYTEENELDNLAAGDTACCNKPPAKI